MKIKGYLQQIEVIAEEACDIGLAEFGRGWEQLTENIRVYNADNSDHQSAEIFDIKVALFRPSKFEFELHQLDKLETKISTAKNQLQELKTEIDGRDEVTKDRKRAHRLAILKQELAELESTAQTNLITKKRG